MKVGSAAILTAGIILIAPTVIGDVLVYRFTKAPEHGKGNSSLNFGELNGRNFYRSAGNGST
jgi:hypothetical protein